MSEHRRRSIRLREYDYSTPGAYFVTICVQHRQCLLGSVANGLMTPSLAGNVVSRKWRDIPRRFAGLSLGSFVLMPNHVHGIILINAPHPDTPLPPALPALGSIIQWFKTGTTYDYIQGVRSEGWRPFNKHLWQRNYWEHVVRTEANYERICAYIEGNPSRWEDDQLHPDNPAFR